jgi:hypothetical protein
LKAEVKALTEQKKAADLRVVAIGAELADVRGQLNSVREQYAQQEIRHRAEVVLVRAELQNSQEAETKNAELLAVANERAARQTISIEALIVKLTTAFDVVRGAKADAPYGDNGTAELGRVIVLCEEKHKNLTQQVATLTGQVTQKQGEIDRLSASDTKAKGKDNAALAAKTSELDALLAALKSLEDRVPSLQAPTTGTAQGTPYGAEAKLLPWTVERAVRALAESATEIRDLTAAKLELDQKVAATVALEIEHKRQVDNLAAQLGEATKKVVAAEGVRDLAVLRTQVDAQNLAAAELKVADAQAESQTAKAHNRQLLKGAGEAKTKSEAKLQESEAKVLELQHAATAARERHREAETRHREAIGAVEKELEQLRAGVGAERGAVLAQAEAFLADTFGAEEDVGAAAEVGGGGGVRDGTGAAAAAAADQKGAVGTLDEEVGKYRALVGEIKAIPPKDMKLGDYQRLATGHATFTTALVRIARELTKRELATATDNERLGEEVRRITEECATQTRNLENANAKLKEAKAEIDKLTLQLAALTSVEDKSADPAEELRLQTQTQQKTIEAKIKSIDSLNADLKEAGRKVVAAQRDKKAAEARLKEYESQLKDLQDRAAQADELKGTVQALQGKLDVKEEDRKAAGARAAGAEEQRREAQAEQAEAKARLEAMLRQLQVSQAVRILLDSNFKSTLETKNAEIKALEVQVAASNTRWDMKNQEVAAAETLSSRFETQLGEEKKARQDDLAEFRAQIDAEKKALEQATAKFKAEIEAEQEKSNRLANDLAAATGDLETKSAGVSGAQQRALTASASLKEVKKKLGAAQNELAAAMMFVRGYKASTDALLEHTAYLGARLAESDSEIGNTKVSTTSKEGSRPWTPQARSLEGPKMRWRLKSGTEQTRSWLSRPPKG